MAASKEKIKARLVFLNKLLGRPTERWTEGAMPNQMNVGHLMLDSNGFGHALVEINSPGGGEVEWSPRLTTGEMMLFIEGIERGITLRNASRI